MCEHAVVRSKCIECRQDQDTKMAVSTLVSLGGGGGKGGGGGGVSFRREPGREMGQRSGTG